MVWFQCEDCGENLKKPKLANHFRICSAYKLSCIDCGQMFSQDSVQSHTQCITEAEKYGPKGQGKASLSAQAKPNKPKPNSEVDVNVGLSSHAPWFCSLCNTQATSKQTLLLHADGKKHRAKARAFHAAQKQSSQAEEPASTENGAAADVPKLESVEANGSKKADESKDRELQKDTTAATVVTEGENDTLKKSKRKRDASSGETTTKREKSAGDLNNGEVIQAVEKEKEQPKPKIASRSKVEGDVDKHGQTKEPSKNKIKWKKLITSTLKSSPQGEMKIRKLQKLVIKALQESGVTEEESQLRDMLMDKINSSSRFVADSKRIRLAPKTEES